MTTTTAAHPTTTRPDARHTCPACGAAPATQSPADRLAGLRACLAAAARR